MTHQLLDPRYRDIAVACITTPSSAASVFQASTVGSVNKAEIMGKTTATWVGHEKAFYNSTLHSTDNCRITAMRELRKMVTSSESSINTVKKAEKFLTVLFWDDMCLPGDSTNAGPGDSGGMVIYPIDAETGHIVGVITGGSSNQTIEWVSFIDEATLSVIKEGVTKCEQDALTQSPH